MQFLVVGQWQGSASSRAMRLGDGASAIGADLPRAATTIVDIPVGAGDRLDTAVARYTAVRAVAEAVAQEIQVATEPVLVIGGDGAAVLGATVELDNAAFVRLAGSSGFRALNRAQPVAAESAVVRILTARPADLFPELPTLAADHVVVAGTRGVDDAERTAMQRGGIRHLGADDTTPAALSEAVANVGADAVFLHVDLDVLDPSEIEGLLEPVPFGLDPARLVELIGAVTAGRRLVGAALTGFAPAAPDRAVDDLGAILRIVGALTAAAKTA